MIFRKFLVRIRKEYNENFKRLLIVSVVGTVLFSGIGLLVDFLMPFEGLGNVVRSLVLIPTSLSMFILGYAIGLFLHYGRMRTNPQWVPFRMRMSPSWRRRISAIVAAVMFVLIYANGFRVGYTPSSSIFVAIGIALFAFMRTTREEAAREKFDIPDVRDVKYNSHMQKLANQRAEAEKEKQQKKKARVDKLIGRSTDIDD